MLYHYCGLKNLTTTIQVKMSRTYYNRQKLYKGYPYYLSFNRFAIQENADWYILVGTYAKLSANINANVKSTKWDTIMLAFTHDEMKDFMNNVKQKRNPMKDDIMFGFGFDDARKIVQIRGTQTYRDMSKYLIEKRINDIENTLK